VISISWGRRQEIDKHKVFLTSVSRRWRLQVLFCQTTYKIVTAMRTSDVTNQCIVFTVLEGISYMLNFMWSTASINFGYIILFAVGSHDNPQKSLCMSVGCGSVVPCRHRPDGQAHCVWHSCWPLTLLFPLRICVDVSRRYVEHTKFIFLVYLM
jgi:hypothetical protein